MNEAGSDVVIIGAGVHGASAAYHLAQSGARVTVVERLTPAGGPTGLSSGVCRAYTRMPSWPKRHGTASG